MTNTTPTDLNKHSVRTVIWKVLKKKHLLGEFVSEPSRNDNQKKEALNCWGNVRLSQPVTGTGN